MVGIWICIGGSVSRRGGTGVLNMADGGFFRPRLSMKRVYVDVSDDRRCGAGTGGARAVAFGGAVSNCICCGSVGFGGGGGTNIGGIGYNGLVSWRPTDVAIAFEDLFGGDF